MAQVLFPTTVPFVDKSGLIDFRWLRVLQALMAALPPGGSGFVVDGSATSFGPMVLYQGLDSAKPGVATAGSIYIALDTGKLYAAIGGSWVLLDPELTGDITKPAGSTVTTLATVFGSPGTYGSPTLTPTLTIDGKGRITGLVMEPIVATATPGGVDGSLQFNNLGTLDGANSIFFDPTTNALVFSNPVPTRENLSPLTVKGDIFVRNATVSTRLPVGTDGQVLKADSAAATGLLWDDEVGPAGSSTEIQFNTGGEFDATPNFTYSSAGTVSTVGLGERATISIDSDTTAGAYLEIKTVDGDYAVGEPAAGIVLQTGNDVTGQQGAVLTLDLPTDTSGGTLFLNSGQGDNGGGLSLSAGNGTAGNGGYVQLFAGSGTNGGGSVTIQAGIAPGGVQPAGDVILNAGQEGDPLGSVKLRTDNLDRLVILGDGTWEVEGDEGSAGEVLTSNGAGSSPSWQTVVGSVASVELESTDGSISISPTGPQTGTILIDVEVNAAGSSTEVQFNTSGSLDASPLLTFDTPSSVATLSIGVQTTNPIQHGTLMFGTFNYLPIAEIQGGAGSPDMQFNQLADGGALIFTTASTFANASNIQFRPGDGTTSNGDLVFGTSSAGATGGNIRFNAGGPAHSQYVITQDGELLLGDGTIAPAGGSAGDVLTSGGAGVPSYWAPASGGSSSPAYELIVATAAQTVFNTTVDTVANGGGLAYLQLFINGVKQVEGPTYGYEVTGANQVTLNSGANVNDIVEFYTFGV